VFPIDAVLELLWKARAKIADEKGAT